MRKGSVVSGHEAEEKAASYLESRGFVVTDRNWRTKWCEIDIVARKSGVVYFVEVKYRRSPDFGTSLEYITTRKLKQMRLAAEIWVSAHGWSGDFGLAAIGVGGEEYTITDAIFDLTV